MTATTLPGLLTKAAATAPDHLAVVDATASLTWGQLDRYANQIANVLRDRGVSPGDRVILRMAKSTHAVAAAYGIMRAGAAYVPLDIDEPIERSRHAIADAAATTAIGERQRKGAWSAFGDSGVNTVLNLGSATAADSPGFELVDRNHVEAAADTPPPVQVSSDMLAYMLYTSGSTGKRKGVMLTHANSMAFVTWASTTANLTAGDRLSSHAPMHFDLSVFDLYSAAHAGATTYIVPKSASMFPATLAAFIAEHEVTVWYSVPTVLRLLTERGGLNPGDLPHLRLIIFAGEVYPPERLRELMQLFAQSEFWNWFGPTETNVCLAHRLNDLPALGEPVPIGRPASGAEAFVVDEDHNQVAPGSQGELLIVGPTVHAGYWGDPERTAASTTVDPTNTTRPAYRTGDLVRLGPSGDYLFDGRNDHQIKTRGYRVELGDIESFLSSQAGVSEAAAVAVPDEQFTHVLHAFVIADAELHSTLVKAARSGLPPYMVPSTITCVSDLPRTLNHKIDRLQLTQHAVAPSPGDND